MTKARSAEMKHGLVASEVEFDLADDDVRSEWVLVELAYAEGTPSEGSERDLHE